MYNIYALNPKSVSEMHFPRIWRCKFTDFANSKKTQVFVEEKMAVDKSAWIKACMGGVNLFELKMMK